MLLQSTVLMPRLDEADQVSRTLGRGPSIRGIQPLPPTYFRVAGITKDSTGLALGNCSVHLFRTSDDLEIDMVTSDASGNYEFRSSVPGTFYYVLAYKAGSPDVAGTTVNYLISL